MGRPNAREHPFLNSKVVKNLTCRQRCSPRRIAECIRVASDDRKSLLKILGLERFIDIQLTSIEIKAVSWTIQNYNYENHSITLHNGKVHKLVPNDVQLVYGLPKGRIDVPSLEDVTRDTTDSWAAELHLVPDPDYYTLNSIKNALDVVESDVDWVRLFFVYVFGCLFCPPPNTHVDLRYLAFVSNEQLLKFKTYNWCKFVLEKFKENMVESKHCSYMKADFYFLIVTFLLNESKLVGGDSVLQSVTNKSVVDFFNIIIGEYCRLKKIRPNADEPDSDDEDNKFEVKKKKRVARDVKLKDLIKADVKKKQKGNVSVEKKHVSKVDVKKKQKGNVPVGKKHVSKAVSKKKRMDKEVDVAHKKLVTKVNAKRKRTTDSGDKKEVKNEVGHRTKRKKVAICDSSVGLEKKNVVLPSAGIFWSDVKGVPEAVSLLDTMVEARNSCTNLIKDYDVAVSSLENFIKNFKDLEKRSKTLKEDGVEHDKKEDEKSVEGDGAENEKEDQKSGAELDTKDKETGAEKDEKKEAGGLEEVGLTGLVDTVHSSNAEYIEKQTEEEPEEVKGAEKTEEKAEEKDEGDGDDRDSVGQRDGLTIDDGVEDADGNNEQEKEEAESKEAGHQQQGRQAATIDSDVIFHDKGGLAEVGLTGLMDTVHSTNAEYIEEQAEEKLEEVEKAEVNAEEEKDEGDDDDDKIKEEGKEKDEGDGDDHDSREQGCGLAVDGSNEEQKKEEAESKEVSGQQQQGGQGAAIDSDVIFYDMGGLTEVGLTGFMDTVDSIDDDYIEEDDDMEDLPKSPVDDVSCISSPLDKLVNAMQLKNIGESSQSIAVPHTLSPKNGIKGVSSGSDLD
ncbi:hypothetical protein LINGRAHAP2_LOCUS15167 [Linum grandiflorum]